MEFKEWLLLNEDASSPGAKQALYPMGYGGIGLYPPSDVITWSADAYVYLPKKIRQITFNWGDGMLSNPFDDDSLYTKLQGKQSPQIQAGNLVPDSDKVTKEYTREVNQKVVQPGSLIASPQGKGFERPPKFIRQSPNSGTSFWDLKQIGERQGKYVLPFTSQPMT